jgi:hypothetical protein
MFVTHEADYGLLVCACRLSGHHYVARGNGSIVECSQTFTAGCQGPTVTFTSTLVQQH